MKKFTVDCLFEGGSTSPFTIFIGTPEQKHHPLHFQSEWLGKERGGQIPQDVMEALSKLQQIAQKNNVSLEELCVYALGTASSNNKQEDNSEPDSDSD